MGVSARACGGIETITRSVTMKLTGIKVSEAKPSDRERKLSDGGGLKGVRGAMSLNS